MDHREFNVIEAIRMILVFSVAAMVIPLSFKLLTFAITALYRVARRLALALGILN